MLYVIKHKGGDPYWEYEKFVRVIKVKDAGFLSMYSYVRSTKRHCTVFTEKSEAERTVNTLQNKFILVPCKDNDEEIIKGLL